MLPLAKILLPVDFSERSAGAAHYARNLADRFHSSVVLLHVVKPFDLMIGGEMSGAVASDWYANRVVEGRKNLDSFLAQELAGVPVDRIILEGDPALEIVNYAHNEHCNLVVMPTHGYGPFRRFILGSVTAKVLHDADCPVFTGSHMVDSPPPEAISFSSILCAVDFGPQSDKALCWAKQMAAEYKARLTITHALPPLEAGEARYFDPAWRAILKQRAEEQMEDLMRRINVKAEIAIESGEVPALVHEVAESVEADVVVIGRHVDAGILGRLRRNSYAIVRESPCPVISV
jgi:nucleotide-binding universal stress UspA family protein